MPNMLDVHKPEDPAGLTTEAWAQGYMVQSMLFLSLEDDEYCRLRKRDGRTLVVLD